jgi:predicted signal transduction protein with EAL and GGDEF domain
VAEMLVEKLSEPYQLEDRECWVSASIGIAIYPENGRDPESLTRSADTAMYAAKADGKNTYQFYTDSMNERARRRITLESRLRNAFEDSQLELHYQPRIDLATDAITGAEALLRWRDPELGHIPPNEFIPVAEETGMIVPIGDWVLHEACAQTRAWQMVGFESLRISVNISAVQLMGEALREAVVKTLWDTGLDARHLEFELTESTLIRDPTACAAVLQGLKELGISIALDDFGTGFSSLSYLKGIPVDTIKIDYAFIRDMLIDGDDAAIVAATISIAEKLRLGVVAEGVETSDQRDFLRRHGCDEVQGYLFSHPLAPDDFLKLLREREPDV